MDIEFAEFHTEHIPAAIELWSNTDGIGLGESDSPDRIETFLDRNPGSSFVALQSGAVIGTVLCGNDGRRGYIHHLAVAKTQRRSGIARELVQRVLVGLRADGIPRCHIMVFEDNELAASFWEGMGWERRGDLRVFSVNTGD
jgi:ribosomal protein S18 acetylase RimI-like enzyme